jgi:hypothetical protein
MGVIEILPPLPWGTGGEKPPDGGLGVNPKAVELAQLGGVRGGNPGEGKEETVDSGFHPHSAPRRPRRLLWVGACIDPEFP